MRESDRALTHLRALIFEQRSTFRTRLCLCFISSLEPKPPSQQQLAAENFGYSSVNRRVGRACVCKSSAFACSSLVSDLSLSLSVQSCAVASSSLTKNERFTHTHTSNSLSLCVYSILRVAVVCTNARVTICIVFCFFGSALPLAYAYAWLHFRFIFALN